LQGPRLKGFRALAVVLHEDMPSTGVPTGVVCSNEEVAVSTEHKLVALLGLRSQVAGRSRIEVDSLDGRSQVRIRWACTLEEHKLDSRLLRRDGPSLGDCAGSATHRLSPQSAGEELNDIREARCLSACRRAGEPAAPRRPPIGGSRRRPSTLLSSPAGLQGTELDRCMARVGWARGGSEGWRCHTGSREPPPRLALAPNRELSQVGCLPPALLSR